jgi:hypothetical protein
MTQPALSARRCSKAHAAVPLFNTFLLIALSYAGASVGFCARPPSGSTGNANVGERFFLETRFSQFFFTNSSGNANFVLTNGDPVMDTTVTVSGALPGSFKDQAMNCRACHLVEEHLSFGNRTYADFAQRSPIPNNGDGHTQTPRNSIDLVDSLLPHSTPLFLHYDGQFATAQDLIISTFTGRNFGWRPTEYATAIAHIAHIVREDDGLGGLAQQYGGWTYAQAFSGGLQIETQYRVAPGYTLYDVTVTNTADPNYVSDQRIIDGIAALVQSYMETLVFSQDGLRMFNGSPYDVFLIKNGLPRRPGVNETPLEYSRRLLRLVSNMPNPQFVTDPADGHLLMHSQAFQFGLQELAGLKIFLTEGKPASSGGAQTVAGNCVTCHSPPAFTDFLFHNTGAAQEEYDSVHGTGAFMSLSVPELNIRLSNYDAFLPPTRNHPNASGTFESPPVTNQPGLIDLGLWNVFANPDFPNPQSAIQQILPLIIPVPPPQITFAARLGNELVLRGTNGTPGWTYYILSSTDVAMAASNWVVVSTNVFDAQGNFSVSNAMTSSAHMFYQLAAAPPSAAQALPRTIALFKTPNLRDLASSDPYFHTGRFNTLQDVITFYRTFSPLARAGLLRNAAPELSQIFLDGPSISPLLAFLRSLNEDYQDIPCPCP